MTSIENLLEQLKAARKTALSGDAADRVRFANLALGAWATIQHALEELDRRRVT